MKTNYNIYQFLIILSLLVASCRKDTKPIPENIKNYLHLSHTRTGINPLMDSVVEQVDYDQFDMLWLGGDLAYLTSADEQTMQHVNSIFDIKSTNTLWALGNHDHTDLDRVSEFTQRPAYYTTSNNGITFVVLDTQDSLSNIVGAQKLLLNNVLDSITESSHLVILHHKLIWMYNNPNLEPQISSISNAGLGSCFYCINPNNFNSEVYPKLVDVKQRGIEVLCIGGDIGFKSKEFEYITNEGINFIASGIHYGKKNNKAVFFTHNLSRSTLTWEYKLITDL
ncbi:MAG: metallophosphoesterase [Crocinitomicaceae bacterium]